MSHAHPIPSASAFVDGRLLVSGPLAEVALTLHRTGTDGVIVLDDASGRTLDLDLRGEPEAILARYAPPAAPADAEVSRTGPGRPKLGVVAREVTLLPRHWDWLATQRGGASVTLRRLIDETRRSASATDRRTAARDAAYRAMATLAGSLPGFEEASRRLFAGDPAGLAAVMDPWPRDVARHVLGLLDGHDPEPAAPAPPPNTHLTVTPEAGAALFRRGLDTPVTMVNLLRLRETADYSADPELAPPEPISGAAALQLYIDHTLPFLTASGGELVLLGAAGPWLIGPPGERWDVVMVVRQSSIGAFLAFNEDTAYLAGIGHRTAALADSRLLPVTDLPTDMTPA